MKAYLLGQIYAKFSRGLCVLYQNYGVFLTHKIKSFTQNTPYPNRQNETLLPKYSRQKRK